MKKNGRKWRKIQAEKATIKSNVKLGEAFSKARNIVHLCYHYGGNLLIQSPLGLPP